MDNRRRKQLQREYRQQAPEAGVYRFVNQRSGRALVGSTLSLPSMRGKLDFARRTGTPSALDHRLWRDVREFGIEAFTFEVLERAAPIAITTILDYLEGAELPQVVTIVCFDERTLAAYERARA